MAAFCHYDLQVSFTICKSASVWVAAKYRQNGAPMQQLNTPTVSPQSHGSIAVRRGLRLGPTTGPQPLELEPHGQGMIDVLPRKPFGLRGFAIANGLDDL
jgi:hypothetical protein